MPRAAELEEFGLEVESEAEHNALLTSSDSTNNAHANNRQRHPLELSTPNRSQKTLLASINTRPSSSSRSGMFKWALLILLLAGIVFMNIDLEKEETDALEESQGLEEVEAMALEEHEGNWVKDEGGYRVFAGDQGGEKESESEEYDDDGESESESENDEEEYDDDGESDDETESEPVTTETQQEPSAEVVIEQTVTSTEQQITPQESTNPNKDTSPSTSKQDNNASTNGKFTLERIASTRTAAQSLISLLENYYFGSEQMSKMLLQSWVGPWNFDVSTPEEMGDMEKKIIDTMIRALVTEDQKEFIIGTIGSSVAAGHDNCQYDSYENQLQRTLSPVWEAAGMTLLCQNAGEGGGCGDNFANQVFCIQQNVSPKIDIAHYSWSYFEVGDHERAMTSRENLVRWAQMMPKQPPVHVINVEGAVAVGEDERELQAHYAKYGYNAFYMRYALREGGYDYNTESENGIDRFGWGYVGDGYHNTTRYGELEEDEGRRDSLGVVLRNWHPGPLGFQTISDAFSMVYSKAILKALDIIEDVINAGHNPNIWAASNRKIVSKKSLPDPLHCDPEYCTVDEGPGCINYELPTYGVWGPRLEDPNNELNPHKGEVQNWEIWQEPKDFWNLVAKEDVIYFQDREDKGICKHLDACGGISATSSDNGMVVFRLPKMEVGLVAICGCCYDTNIATPMFINNTNIEVRYNGALLDPADWDLFPNNKCARLLKRFPTEGAAAQTPTGHAYLSIKALDGLDTPVRISHVITL